MVEAVARPDEAGDVERIRSLVRETLVEDEILDVRIDLLSQEEFVREVCRKIGYPPDPAWLPQGWADVAEATDAVTAETAGCSPAEGWPQAPNALVRNRPLPAPLKPDSS